MAPTGSKKSWVLSLLVALALLAGACGGGGNEEAGQETASSDTTASTDTTAAPQPAGQGGRQSATGAPIGRPSGGATGAPVRVPAITQLQGVRLDERLTVPGEPTLLQHIQNQFAEACGGTLCVTLRIVDQTGRPGEQSCRFSRLEPRSGTVPRDSVVKIVVDCDDPSSGSGSSPSDDGTR